LQCQGTVIENKHRIFQRNKYFSKWVQQDLQRVFSEPKKFPYNFLMICVARSNRRVLNIVLSLIVRLFVHYELSPENLIKGTMCTGNKTGVRVIAHCPSNDVVMGQRAPVHQCASTSRGLGGSIVVVDLEEAAKLKKVI
jgi:hypothetical protein